ncbi:MAG: phage holin family protein [Clostridiales bacterium]|nr:phage holin family protein [Clostridiales bacterium]
MDTAAIKNSVIAMFAVIGGCIAGALGGWDVMLKALLTVMTVDYIMGLIIALVFHKSPKTESGRASSDKCIKGIFKKGVILLIVLVAAQLDSVTGGEYVRNIVISFFIGSEGLSILENAGIIGIPFPAFLKNALEALQDKGDAKNST